MKREDPRAVRSRSAMLAAARDLLHELGPAAVTHQRVAVRAGVGRATVYRHWTSNDELLQEAMEGAEFPFFADLEGPLGPALARELRRLADEMAVSTVARLGVTWIERAHFDETARARYGQLQALIAARLARAFAAAAARGEAEPLTDPDEAVAALLGPVMYRTLVQHATVSDDLIERSVAVLGLPTSLRQLDS